MGLDATSCDETLTVSYYRHTIDDGQRGDNNEL